MRGMGGEFPRDKPIYGQQDAAAGLFGLCQNILGGVVKLGFRQGLAQICALCAQKRIGHAAPDHQQIQPVHEVFQQLDLGRYFGTAHHRAHGAFRGGQRGLKRRKLGLHQTARTRGQEPRDPFGRRMGAVRGREGIVAIDVAQTGQTFGKIGVVLGLARIETDVFKQQYIGGVDLFGARLGGLERFGQHDFAAQGSL